MDYNFLQGNFHQIYRYFSKSQYKISHYSIHICITDVHTQDGVADQFVNDVKEQVAEIMKSPGEVVEGKMAIYGVSQALPDRSLVGDFIKLFLDSLLYTPPPPHQHGNGK